jgi:actin related protein 2/3 complex, subunit 3
LQNEQEATKSLNALALENFNIPGEPGFPLNPLYAAPANRNDAGTFPPDLQPSCFLFWAEADIWEELLRQYLSQFRQELAMRLAGRIYVDNSAVPSKWWMSFKKRLFMNKSLSS